MEQQEAQGAEEVKEAEGSAAAQTADTETADPIEDEKLNRSVEKEVKEHKFYTQTEALLSVNSKQELQDLFKRCHQVPAWCHSLCDDDDDDPQGGPQAGVHRAG